MTPRPLTGQEDIVLFNQHDEFTGGSAEWLRPRLRLHPQVAMVDPFQGPGLSGPAQAAHCRNGRLGSSQ
jgi:hypothetical protein